jgi:hypothetical protein
MTNNPQTPDLTITHDDCDAAIADGDTVAKRSDRLEEKLHDLTEFFAHLVSQRDRLVAQSRMKSKASIKYHEGREVLYLEQPVNLHLLGQVRH